MRRVGGLLAKLRCAPRQEGAEGGAPPTAVPPTKTRPNSQPLRRAASRPPPCRGETPARKREGPARPAIPNSLPLPQPAIPPRWGCSRNHGKADRASPAVSPQGLSHRAPSWAARGGVCTQTPRRSPAGGSSARRLPPAGRRGPEGSARGPAQVPTKLEQICYGPSPPARERITAREAARFSPMMFHFCPCKRPAREGPAVMVACRGSPARRGPRVLQVTFVVALREGPQRRVCRSPARGDHHAGADQTRSPSNTPSLAIRAAST
jgi:hypothetical protein